jgi:hypothetical protein
MSPIKPITGVSTPYNGTGNINDALMRGTAPDPYSAPYTGGGSVTNAHDAHGFGDPLGDPYADPSGTGGSGIAPEGVGAVQPINIFDIAALGVLSSTQLAQLDAMQLAPHELETIYVELLGQLQQGQQPIDPGYGAETDPPSSGDEQYPVYPSDPVEPSAPLTFNSEVEAAFRDMLKEQGVSSKGRILIIQQLKQAGLTGQDLELAYAYYSTSPEGQAELREIDKMAKAGEGQNMQLAILAGGVAGAGLLGTTALARSSGNATNQVVRLARDLTFSHNIADQALGERVAKFGRGMQAGSREFVGTAQANEAAALLRQKAGKTNRLLHPIDKMRLNAAARHLTPSSKLSRADIVRYGLWMKNGDAVRDASRGATAAKTGAVIGGGADDAARGAANAAKVAGGASKFTRALGPIGLIASAGLGVWSVKETMKAEGGFGEESAKIAGNVGGGIAGGVAGAAAGAAIGSVVPVIGTGIGAVVGGIVGGFGGGAIGEKLGGLFGK